MNPQMIEPYIKKDIPKCRWNYLVLDDIALGSAIICQRELLIGYLEIIANKVIYAEDNIYRLMMFDGVAADYYPDKVLFYECGAGISTSGDSKWGKLLMKDWIASTQIMLSRSNCNDVFQSKIVHLMLKKWPNNRIMRDVFKMNINGWLGIG